ncbi:unnamed protein product [Heligmosomoides polygyrus]|uniref:Uncharacterized protein n=1 Tax=Heligmosomoides polygyrus TaxID=6339 RepID=A0A183G0N9_HELPZ|nr:unnamed protein product [Heligmosomoides polygyrus]
MTYAEERRHLCIVGEEVAEVSTESTALKDGGDLPAAAEKMPAKKRGLAAVRQKAIRRVHQARLGDTCGRARTSSSQGGPLSQ